MMSEKLEAMRHSASHVMAEAVRSMFPEVKFGIGPAIDDGFYYDFDLSRTLTPDDLVTIETKMNEIIATDAPFTGGELSKDEAKKLFADQPYKLELIDDLPDEKVSIYRQGDFVDLCKGPHIDFTGQIKAVKLLNIAGAYWRGDEKKPMLQRIYGTAFPSRKDLKKYLARLEEAAKRDHRRLGKDLELFSMHDEAGAGLAYWHPKGGMVRKLVEDFWRDEHIKRGYDIVFTPHIAKIGLWKTSGHLDFYRDSMYSPMDIDGQEYQIKPMNCPAHILMYKNRLRSYRELPLRWAELGTVYRYERSGALHGLTRVRGFTQDDAHIFCTPEQLENEVADVVEFALFMLRSFGFNEYEIYLSTRPDKYVGSLEVWDMATETLKKALERLKIDYIVDPGEGVFYGPKIDIKLKDALGRTWQGPTTQVDFNLPERFMGCLIEHYAGAFPVWLAPVQAMLIPIADRHIDYAQKVAGKLKSQGIRVEVDARSERMNLKIRDAQMQKVPYMLIVGDREAEQSEVAVRTREGEDLKGQSIEAFAALAKETIESKT